jgi:hypothetical protein
MPPRPLERIWDVLVVDLHTTHKPASCASRDSHGLDLATKMPHGSGRIIAALEAEGQQQRRRANSSHPQEQWHGVQKNGIARHSWEVFKSSRRRACCTSSKRVPAEPHNTKFFLASLIIALALVETSGECTDVNEISKVPCSMNSIFTDDAGYIQPAGLCVVDKCVPHAPLCTHFPSLMQVTLCMILTNHICGNLAHFVFEHTLAQP